MYDYLEECFDNGTDIGLEMDVIALCYDFTEYECLEEFNQNYNIEAESIEDIKQETIVISIDDERFIIHNF